jgi:hypothetical protein
MTKKITDKNDLILEFIKANPNISSKEIHDGIASDLASIEHKKAMLLFYEQNNITAIKKIFIEQFEFAVATYF